MNKLFFIAPLLFIQMSILAQPELVFQQSHEATITALEYSSSGNYLVSGDKAGVNKIWDVQSGRLLNTDTNLGGKISKITSYPNKMKFLIQQKDVVRLVGYSGKTYLKFEKKSIVDSDISPDGNNYAVSTKKEVYLRSLKVDSTIQMITTDDLVNVTESTYSIKEVAYLSDSILIILQGGILTSWNIYSNELKKLNYDEYLGVSSIDGVRKKTTNIDVNIEKKRILLSNDNYWKLLDFQYNIVLKDSINSDGGKSDWYSSSMKIIDENTVGYSIISNDTSIFYINSFGNKIEFKNEEFLNPQVWAANGEGEISISEPGNSQRNILLYNNSTKIKRRIQSTSGFKNLKGITTTNNSDKLVFGNEDGEYVYNLNLLNGETHLQTAGYCQTEAFYNDEKYLVNVDFFGKYVLISLIGEDEKVKRYNFPEEFNKYVFLVDYLSANDKLYIIAANKNEDDKTKFLYEITIDNNSEFLNLNKIIEFSYGIEAMNQGKLLLKSNINLSTCYLLDYSVKKPKIKELKNYYSVGTPRFIPATNDFIEVSENAIIRYSINGNETSLIWRRDINRKTSYVSSIALGKESMAFATGDGYIYLFDIRDGKRLNKGKRFHIGSINELIFSYDDERLITASYDGSMKIISIDEFATVCTIVPIYFENKSGWDELRSIVVYTPDGYFYSNDINPELFHYVDNKKVYTYDQFDVHFNRPDIVFERIGGPSEETKLFHLAYLKRLENLGVSEEAFENIEAPELEIYSRSNIPSITNLDSLEIKLKVKSIGNELHDFMVWVNGVPSKYSLTYNKVEDDVRKLKISLKLSAGLNRIQMAAIDTNGIESLIETVDINKISAKASKPDVYFVGIGVANYNDSYQNLSYPIKDINDMVDVFKRNKNYNEVFVDTIFNKDFKKERLVSVEKFISSADVDDIVILYYSGHGLLSENKDFFLSTSISDFNNPENTSVSYYDLIQMFGSIDSRKRMIFLDACHSGELDVNGGGIVKENKSTNLVTKGDFFKAVESKRNDALAFDKMKELFIDVRREYGITILAGSSGLAVSLEDKKFENGLFTYAIKNGLIGEADKNQDNNCTVEELSNYVLEEVLKLSNGQQKPTVRGMNVINNFVVY